MVEILSDPRCLSHASPVGYPETAARLQAILAHLRASGREIVSVAEHEAAEEAVMGVHEETYVARFRRAVERGDGLLDSADNPLSEGTWEAAWAAVAVSLTAADRVAAEGGGAAFAAVRPPGHHAERGHAMGFCFFDNIAVAAEYLRRQHGFDRLAIVDFDVHHGNGTQHIFEGRSDVFFASTHQYPFYPGTGAAAERGRGDGEGATLNLPLPAGSGDDDYRRAFEEAIWPALEDYDPQVLLVSAGFDAWRDDPLGGMRVSEEGFASWGRLLAEMSGELCEGRLLVTLEGGYDLRSLPILVERFLAGAEATPR